MAGDAFTAIELWEAFYNRYPSAESAVISLAPIITRFISWG